MKFISNQQPSTGNAPGDLHGGDDLRRSDSQQQFVIRGIKIK